MVEYHSRDRPDVITESLQIIFREDENRVLPERFTKMLAALEAKQISEKSTEKRG